MTTVQFGPRVLGVHYDTTNGGEIISSTGATLVSAVDANPLVFTAAYDTVTVHNGNWYVWIADGNGGITAIGELTQSEISARYSQYATAAAVETLNADVATPRPVRHGKAAVGTLLLGASTTVEVTLSSAMPTATYSADAVVWSGTSLLGALEVTAVAVVDESTVAVTVHNTGLVSLAGSILVTAVG